MPRVYLPRYRIVLLPLVLVTLVPACYKWAELDTASGLPERLPSPARITLVDGEEVRLQAARVIEDSIVGYDEERTEVGADGAASPRRIAVPVERVRRVDRWAANAPAAAGAAVFGMLGLFASIILLSDFPSDR